MTFFSIHDTGYIRNFARALKTTKASNKNAFQIFRMTKEKEISNSAEWRNFELSRDLSHWTSFNSQHCPKRYYGSIRDLSSLVLAPINPKTTILGQSVSILAIRIFFQLAYRHCIWVSSISSVPTYSKSEKALSSQSVVHHSVFILLVYEIAVSNMTWQCAECCPISIRFSGCGWHPWVNCLGRKV